MSKLSLELPTLQNWSCHNCGGCCRQHAIEITEAERKRIESQNWGPDSGIPAGQPLFRVEKSFGSAPRIRLAHLPDGGCVFLDEKGLCRIHGKFGEAAKPLACQIYPYAFHPAGSKLAVSLRFSCPSVADNLGKPVVQQLKSLKRLADDVVPTGYQPPPAPPLSRKQQLSWPDTLAIITAIDQSLTDVSVPLPLQLLRTLVWVDLLEESKFQKISGQRLTELLILLRESSSIEYPELPTGSSPSAIALSQFRLLSGQYVRKDTESSIDLSWSGRFRQLKNAISLSRRRGSLPEIDNEFQAVPRAALDRTFGSLPEKSTEMLRRFLRVKVQGLHFCGKACYDLPVGEGLRALFLTIPSICWIAKWRAASSGRDVWTHEDLREALNRVDHQHGYSPHFGNWGARRRVQNLAATGDLQKLIVWASQ